MGKEVAAARRLEGDSLELELALPVVFSTVTHLSAAGDDRVLALEVVRHGSLASGEGR